MSLETMASKGEAKYQRKLGQMATNYQASVGRAQENFSGVGFGPNTTAAYRAGVSAGAGFYADGVQRGVGKWRRNWISRVSQ